MVFNVDRVHLNVLRDVVLYVTSLVQTDVNIHVNLLVFIHAMKCVVDVQICVILVLECALGYVL